jgi:hypothetical protein
LLAARTTDPYAATNVLTNPALAGVPHGVLSIVRERFVGHGMHEDLDITDHGDSEPPSPSTLIWMPTSRTSS